MIARRMAAVEFDGTRNPISGTGPSGGPRGDLGAIQLEQLHKVYGKDVHALRGIDLTIGDGEFITLLGPSGSGKSTLLMVIAGFEQPTRGRVLARHEDITARAPHRRNFGVVFQNYALFPHMTTRENVAYPLKVRRVARADVDRRVEEVLDLVGLAGLGSRRPSQLSGGQQQRVALARALVYSPDLLLLDEPLGALDRALRERMQLELMSVHRTVGCTFLYVTHDQDEALAMSTRIVVMRDGVIEQVGTPEEVYFQPATRFVASFVGTANLFTGTIVQSQGTSCRVRLENGVVVAARSSGPHAAGAPVTVLVRPERVRVSTGTPDGDGDSSALEGRIAEGVFVGGRRRYVISTAIGPVEVHAADAVADADAPVWLDWVEEHAFVMPAADDGMPRS